MTADPVAIAPVPASHPANTAAALAPAGATVPDSSAASKSASHRGETPAAASSCPVAPDLSVAIGSVVLKNPVMPASGTFNADYGRLFPLGLLGAIVPKTVMAEARPGHAAPRLVETAGGLINAIGIPSVGIAAFLADVLPLYLGHGAPVIVSVSAGSAAAFAALVRRLERTGVAAVELNLSCPNLEAGGRAFALDAAATGEVVAACRTSPLPLWAKLSPNAASPADIARAAAAAGADALIAGNTLTALALRSDGRPALANRTGGLSGAPLKPVALRVADEVCRAVAIPVIGCGGIATFRDALDYLAVGCVAVAVGSATFSRPRAMPDLIDALAAHCTDRGLAVRDLVGRSA